MNELQYRNALRAIDSFMIDDPVPGTYMGDALDALSRMCEQYEKMHFHFDTPTDEQLAEFRRLERGL